MVVGEGDDQLLEVDVVTLQGCHCSVLWVGGGRLTTLGRWTWCHCWVLVCYGWGGRGGDEAEWTGCDCWVAEPRFNLSAIAKCL